MGVTKYKASKETLKKYSQPTIELVSTLPQVAITLPKSPSSCTAVKNDMINGKLDSIETQLLLLSSPLPQSSSVEKKGIEQDLLVPVPLGLTDVPLGPLMSL